MNARRLALVVQGRFHLLHMAAEFIRLGHDVTVFTNFPEAYLRRCGLPRDRVVSNVWHGFWSRSLTRVPGLTGAGLFRKIDQSFSDWVCREVPRHGPWDAVFCMSGVAKELFEELGTSTFKALHRGSIHIRAQHLILEQEEREGGGRVDRPSDWMIQREELEYSLADQIRVQSEFALDSFVEHGVPAERVKVLRMGTSITRFRAKPTDLQARLDRLGRGEPLRIICIGQLSRRKGARTWHDFFQRSDRPPTQVRMLGSINSDAGRLVHEYRSQIEWLGYRPEEELPEHYAWADVMVLPSLEDGFPAVVAQALAAYVPVITTTSCGASCLIQPDISGWIIPPHRPDLLADLLKQLHQDRSRLVRAVEALRPGIEKLDWSHVAAQAMKLFEHQKRDEEKNIQLQGDK
jgi:glycosyltransferase involved in cell wall biosynthesis